MDDRLKIFKSSSQMVDLWGIDSVVLPCPLENRRRFLVTTFPEKVAKTDHTCLDFSHSRNFLPPPHFSKIVKISSLGHQNWNFRSKSRFGAPKNANFSHKWGYTMAKMTIFRRLGHQNHQFSIWGTKVGGSGGCPPKHV